MTEDGSVTTDWFRETFGEDYLHVYSERTREQAAVEVGFVIEKLRITPQDRVLDLCCGYGRHLDAFAARGIRAQGIDLSVPLLRRASANGHTALICGDMRSLPLAGGENGFDAVVSFFTSFGYFAAESDHVRAAAELARVLRPRGRFSMDLLNPEPTIRELQPTTQRQIGPLQVVEHRRHNAAARRLHKRIEVTGEDGRTRTYTESVRYFSRGEIETLLAKSGLRVEEHYGDFSGGPCNANSPRLIVTGRKANP